MADAESKAVDSRVTAAQLRTAAAVRCLVELAAPAANRHWPASAWSAQKLEEDVRRRTKAGDLARSDQHQADGGATASAEVTLAESRACRSHPAIARLDGQATGREKSRRRTEKPAGGVCWTSPPWMRPTR